MRPRTLAVVAADGELSYVALNAAVERAARVLLARGVRAGDRVAIALPARLAFVVALHACLRIGVVAVPVDLRLSGDERAARTAGCALVLDAPIEGGDDHGVALPDTHDLDTVAVIIHTSGTTSAPKPVALTYGNWLWSALGSATALGLDPDERWLCTLPLSHVGGLSIVLRSAIYATTAVVHDGFDAEHAAVELMGQATLVSVVATTLARLLDAGLSRPPALRAALIGGGPIPHALLRRAAAAEVPTVTTYGLSEACSQVTTGGSPLFCSRVAISETGEILVAGPTVAPGAVSDDGWLHTGDLGALNAEGQLTVTGRAVDTIVSGGENVVPAEVEAVLSGHPAVADAAVLGRPDPEWGERVEALVVMRTGAEATAGELREHCLARLAGFKVPKRFSFVSSLPRTASGKLLRRSLEE